MSSFTVAIASGKGGTGKTTVAVNLAALLAERGVAVQYLDGDVEEPNGHLFLKPALETSEAVGLPVPVIDADKCTACGRCAEVCEFNALVVLKRAMVFPELCHGCGGCVTACPAGAIREEPRAVGVVETGRAGAILFAQGRMNVGEAMAPPVIRALKRARADGALVLLDTPPGTACPVVAAARDADYVLLVTEPTPFGLHDLRLAVELMRRLERPFGVVINRAGSGDDAVNRFCREAHIPVLAEIPDDRAAAEAYSRGELMNGLPGFQQALDRLSERILSEMSEKVRA
ncbi:MAG TPA: ATP-binding protein [Kiritimatiellia bacterium]|nr:ATP-binding protein [Kiritimatiellia bacterium]HRZ10920.1 ATP-binding protein [Kiritimatiellia bacterium]HSA18807.1 ATP-binding protein [Kiritimatiellia bacterium]